MDTNIRFSGVLAWMVLGLAMGFVTYSVLSLYLFSEVLIAIFAGAFSAAATILLYREQQSDADKFFIGLCAVSIAALASAVKYLKYQIVVDFTVSSLFIGIIIGIILSMALVVYLIND